MKLYNSFSQKLETLDIAKKISLYVCGITPYDTTHLGHAFTFIFYDVLVRYLRFLGKKVVYIQNVTDIDDDILLRAESENVNWKVLGNRETQKYLSDMKDLNMLPFDRFVKATAHISEMIAIIRKLVSYGFAYESGGNVY